MFEVVPEYIWAGTTIVLYAGLLILPCFWFHPVNASATAGERSLRKSWNSLGVMVAAGLLFLECVLTTVWLFPPNTPSVFSVTFGFLTLTPTVVVSTGLAWIVMWPHMREKFRIRPTSLQVRQLTIGQLMVGMIFFAMAMGTVRLAYESSPGLRALLVFVGFLVSTSSVAGVVIARASNDEKILQYRSRTVVDDDPGRPESARIQEDEWR